MPELVIQAAVLGIKTTRDGGWTFSFEAPEDAAVSMAALSSLRGKVLNISIETAE